MTISVVVAGLSKKVVGRFADDFQDSLKGARIVASPAIGPAGYTTEYAERIYASLADALKKRGNTDWRRRPSLRLVVLYLDAPGDGTRLLVERLALEAMLLPLQAEQAWSANTANQVGQVIDVLLRESERALAAARGLMAVIDEELNQRRNRTCLLLPKHNYGKYFGGVMACVRDAAKRRLSEVEFRERIRQVAGKLPKDSKRRYIGRKDLVFEPAKAQHGRAPLWGDDEETPGEHVDSCVIRGRVRFGVPFDPKVHYDCKLPNPRRNPQARRFISCHGQKTLEPKRRHANIAPNDNVR